jgi:hypothetical protein
MAGKKKESLLSHHDFREYIAHAWISPTTHGRGEGFGYHTMRQSKKRRKRGTEDNQQFAITPESFYENIQTRGATVAATTEERATTAMGNKRPYMTDKSLAHNGCLSCRLDKSRSHYPIQAQGPKVKCGVHRWCAGIEKRSQVMDCESCGVALCLPCFKLFHETVDLVQKKDSLKKKFKEEWDANNALATKRT